MRVLLIVVSCALILLIYSIVKPKSDEIKNQQFKQNVDTIKSITKTLPRENKIVYPVLYINLDRSLQRKIDIEDQFKKFGISATRIPAIDGSSKDKGIDFTSDYNLTESELGCVLSHLKAIKYAYDNNLDSVVITEDDISLELMPLWSKTVYDIANEAGDWDLIQLGNSSCDFSDLVTVTERQGKKCYGAFFYIINRKGIENIIDSCFENDKIVLSSKMWTDKRGYADFLLFRAAGRSKSYMTPLVYTTNKGSTIQDEHEMIALEYWNKVLVYYIRNFYSNVELENTWIVNLDRSPDRLECSRKRLGNININAKRWRATDSKSPEFIEFYDKIAHPKRSIGEVACYISHKTLWKHVYDANIPYAIIFEDDIVIPKDIDKYDIFVRIKDSPGFNVIFLGHCYSNSRQFESPHSKKGAAQCTHAYVISRTCIENLLLQPDDFSLPIDKILDNMCREELCYISNSVDNNGQYGEGIIHQDDDFESSLKSERGLAYL